MSEPSDRARSTNASERSTEERKSADEPDLSVERHRKTDGRLLLLYAWSEEDG